MVLLFARAFRKTSAFWYLYYSHYIPNFPFLSAQIENTDNKSGHTFVNKEGIDDKFSPSEFNVEMTLHLTPPIIAKKRANEHFTRSEM